MVVDTTRCVTNEKIVFCVFPARSLRDIYVLREVSLKIARYAIYDDAIIAVRINTNDNGINKNYRVNKTSVRRRAFAFKSDRVKRLRERG
jgi:hypothetical protein